MKIIDLSHGDILIGMAEGKKNRSSKSDNDWPQIALVLSAINPKTWIESDVFSATILRHHIFHRYHTSSI